MNVRRIDIRATESTLRDLQGRLATARLPVDPAANWNGGANPAYMRELLDYWRTEFDWHAQEAELLKLAHYTTHIDGVHIHFIHERGRGTLPMPIVLTHGFPDSYYRFCDLIPLLTDPEAHGGDPDDAFDVVVPSLPGFAHSGPAETTGDFFHVADRWHTLMTELGYPHYAAHGGDWGSTITEHLGRSHARAVVGIHLTDVPFWHALRKPHHRSAAEDAYLAAIDRFQMCEGAYAVLQGNRPQTLADVFADSPVGLCAWIVDFFARWSDCDGDIERSFTKDQLLTNVMIYWTTNSFATACAPYHDVMHAGPMRILSEVVKQKLHAKRVPAGFALFPKDLTHPPREWAERFFDVQRWTEMPRGGHFTALEEPQLLAEELRAFFRPLRARLAPVRIAPARSETMWQRTERLAAADDAV